MLKVRDKKSAEAGPDPVDPACGEGLLNGQERILKKTAYLLYFTRDTKPVRVSIHCNWLG
jgi:hypothetical protein